MRSFFCLSATLVAAAAACGAPAQDAGQLDDEAASTIVPGSVEAATHGGCSTQSVRGLSEQIVDEINCASPGALAAIESSGGVTLTADVFPYLQPNAADALSAAGANAKMTIDSAFRTAPQQYLLYRWYQMKRCSIGLAAPVSKSNHEQGLAVDAVGGRQRALVTAGFVWFGSGDPVHHELPAAGNADVTTLGTRAFQRLWNRNHPEDPVAEDGVYTPALEQRLKRAPANGFDDGAQCDADAGTDPAD